MLPLAGVGRPYRAAVLTAGGEPPLEWSLRGALPEGIRFQDGVLSGTGTRPSVTPVVLTATDRAGRAARRATELRVSTFSGELAVSAPARRWRFAGEDEGLSGAMTPADGFGALDAARLLTPGAVVAASPLTLGPTFSVEVLFQWHEAPGLTIWSHDGASLVLRDDGRLVAAVTTAGGVVEAAAATRVRVGQGVHAVVTSDGVHLRLYVDAELDGVAPIGASAAARGPLTFGGGAGAVVLDEAAWYTRAVEAAEVADHVSVLAR